MIKDVMLPFAALMTLNTLLMILWTVIDPVVWERTPPDDSQNSFGSCETKGNASKIFVSLIVAINLIALVMANYQAFKARSIATEFSESFYLGFILVCILQALVLCIPLLVIVDDNIAAKYFVYTGFIFVTTS